MDWLIKVVYWSCKYKYLLFAGNEDQRGLSIEGGLCLFLVHTYYSIYDNSKFSPFVVNLPHFIQPSL